MIVQSRSRYATTPQTPLKVERTFNVNYENPCVETSLVWIEASTLPDKNYGNKWNIEESFSVLPFEITTSGITPASAVSLCGNLVYTAEFQDKTDTVNVIGSADQPLAYEALAFTILNADVGYFNLTR